MIRCRITRLDRALARVALAELDQERHVVALIPCDVGDGKKRVAVSQNPEWYRVFIHRREKPLRKWRDRERWVTPKNRQTRGGRRALVRRALQRIADNRPHQGNQHGWIGWELLELLRDIHERPYYFA